jgi:hypothetical protein
LIGQCEEGNTCRETDYKREHQCKPSPSQSPTASQSPWPTRSRTPSPTATQSHTPTGTESNRFMRSRSFGATESAQWWGDRRLGAHRRPGV